LLYFGAQVAASPFLCKFEFCPTFLESSSS
jgi:hypothetical protein